MPKRQPPRRERGSPPLAALGVFLATAAVYGARLNSPGLLEPDEARYAAVGQSMLTDRDLVTPRFNGLIYLDKPPLLHWLTAASLAAFGRQEFAVRLSSVLAAAAGVALIYAFGRHVHGHRAGLASALVLASTVMWFGVGRVIRYDMLLALSIAATLWWAYLASELGRQGRGYYCLAAAAAGLGVLAKGPVAVGLPGLVFVAYLASTRRLRVLLDVPWPACLGILGGIAIPWFVLCERANPGAVRFFLVHENLLRVKGETNPTHWEPWWYFLAVFPGACLPWTLFLPGAVHSGATASGPGEEGNRRACRLWLLWLVATLLLFSVPRAKLMAYVLPAVPPAALLVGRHLSPACRGGRWAALITGLLLVSGAFAWVTIGARAAAKQGVPGEVLIPAMAGCWLVGGLAAAFLVSGGLFTYLDVRDEGDRLSVRFGPLRLFGTLIHYDAIESVEASHTRLIDGFGMHGFPGVYIVLNIWGMRAVRVRLKRRRGLWRARTVFIGTDEPEALHAFLRDRIGRPAAPS